jgi:hypothetical protein
MNYQALIDLVCQRTNIIKPTYDEKLDQILINQLMHHDEAKVIPYIGFSTSDNTKVFGNRTKLPIWLNEGEGLEETDPKQATCDQMFQDSLYEVLGFEAVPNMSDLDNKLIKM